MAQDFQNPSFEEPGDEPGLALDWNVSINSSLYGFVVFERGVSTTIVLLVAATLPLGVTVLENDDGTIQLIEAVGVTESVESFSYGWKSNQFYLFAIPSAFLKEARFSVGKEQEDYEDGFGIDDNFKVGLGATDTIIPLVGRTLVVNEFAGRTVNINGEKRTVASNTTTAITVSAVLTLAPAENRAVRIIGGALNDVGFLDDITDVTTESFEDAFNTGWPGSVPFKDEYGEQIVLGTLDNNVFTPGSSYPTGLPEFNSFANDLRTLVYSTDADRQTNNLLVTFIDPTGATHSFFPMTIVVPFGTDLDAVNGTLVPLKSSGVAFGSLSEGMREITGMVEATGPSGKFSIVGSPGLDLERAHF